MIDINEIYKEANTNDDRLRNWMSESFIGCTESVEAILRLIHETSKASPAVWLAANTQDKLFLELIRVVSAFNFEAGRLYGRQQIVDETLGGLSE